MAVFEMHVIRDVCQAILEMLGVIVAIKDNLSKSNKICVVIAFAMLTLVAFYAGHATDREASNRLTKALDEITLLSKITFRQFDFGQHLNRDA